MKRFLLVIPAWLLMALALCFVIAKKRAETFPLKEQANDPGDRLSSRHHPETNVPEEIVNNPKSLASAAKAELPRPNRTEEVLLEIESTVITYSPEGVAPISAHLLDSDPIVRDSARRGLRQLGEAAAVPLLRRAAAQLDEAESKACLEAAAFLELPSWSGTEEARTLTEKLSESSEDP